MIQALEFANHLLFYYYVVCNLAYLTMLLIALKGTAGHQRRLKSVSLSSIKQCPLAPPVTILTPAHNEEKSICMAVRHLLGLDYPELEVIVINDGSTDRTFQSLQQGFALRPVRAVYVPQVPTALVRGMYRSDLDPRLLVVDKEPGGSKADAVNAGLNAATSPYVCVVDADSVLEPDALLRIMVPVLTDPKRVVSAGGIVRVLNGVYSRQGRTELALQALDRALTLDPQRADLHAACGRALRAAHNLSAARLEFQRALDLDPTNEEARTGLFSLRGDPRHELRLGVNTVCQSQPVVSIAGEDRQNLAILLLRLDEPARPQQDASAPCPDVHVLRGAGDLTVNDVQGRGPVLLLRALSHLLLPARGRLLPPSQRADDPYSCQHSKCHQTHPSERLTPCLIPNPYDTEGWYLDRR